MLLRDKAMVSEVEIASVRLLDRQSDRPGAAQREFIMVSVSDVRKGEDVDMS